MALLSNTFRYPSHHDEFRPCHTHILVAIFTVKSPVHALPYRTYRHHHHHHRLVAFIAVL